MARLVVDGSQLVVRLSPLERLGALAAADPAVPLSAVRDVRVVPRPAGALRGLRAPGAGFPGVIALGTWRSVGGRDFAAVYGRGPGIVVELEGARWRRLVVSSHEAEHDAERVRAALPAA